MSSMKEHSYFVRDMYFWQRFFSGKLTISLKNCTKYYFTAKVRKYHFSEISEIFFALIIFSSTLSGDFVLPQIFCPNNLD
jgi:hypothetical protein